MKIFFALITCLTLSFSVLAESNQKSVSVEGFLEQNKDKRYFVIDSGKTIFYLKRQETFLANELELKKATGKKSTWLKLKVPPSAIVRKAPSPRAKAAAEVL